MGKREGIKGCVKKMEEGTKKILVKAGKVALWVVIPGGVLLASWAIYRHFYPSEVKPGSTVTPAPPKYQGVKSGNEVLNQNGPILTNP